MAARLQMPTYRSWSTMLTRCFNPNSPGYAYYGARGIQVCDRWLDFRNFHADMGTRPEWGTLDRINTIATTRRKKLPLGDLEATDVEP
jgi:hypothetical protein